jgi:type III secretion protein L
MAFIVPRHPLTPRSRLATEIDSRTRIVRAGDLALYREAEGIVAAAHEQAEAIVAGAHAALEAERRRGYEEGRERAAREATQHMAEQMARAEAYRTRVEGGLADVVVQALRKIVGGYDDRERALHAVRNALALVRNQERITVRVHPDNLTHVKARAGELVAEYPAVGLLDVVADVQLGLDCCVLDSEIGIVEAGTEGQLAALEAALRGVSTATG